jgi:hypothetical protein
MLTPPPDPDARPVAVTLSVVEWNQVLAGLAEGPFRIVAPLIGKIRQQAMEALGPAPGAVANGNAEVGDGLAG